MKKHYYIRELLTMFCLSLIFNIAFAQAQSPKEEFNPHSGQEGKDVVWVPTPYELVEEC